MRGVGSNKRSSFSRWAIAFSAVSAAAVPAPVGADPGAGERVFAQCKACHRLEAGKNAVGPSLHSVFGRRAGTAPNFNYSADMKAAGERGLVWSEHALLAYIEHPQEFIGKIVGKDRALTRMMFPGLPDQEQRENLLAYLKRAAR